MMMQFVDQIPSLSSNTELSLTDPLSLRHVDDSTLPTTLLMDSNRLTDSSSKYQTVLDHPPAQLQQSSIISTSLRTPDASSCDVSTQSNTWDVSNALSVADIDTRNTICSTLTSLSQSTPSSSPPPCTNHFPSWVEPVSHFGYPKFTEGNGVQLCSHFAKRPPHVPKSEHKKNIKGSMVNSLLVLDFDPFSLDLSDDSLQCVDFLPGECVKFDVEREDSVEEESFDLEMPLISKERRKEFLGIAGVN
ncbi:hypothetical protein P9112_013831 [Eukaryota sp. TZLM1-RC]